MTTIGKPIRGKMPWEFGKKVWLLIDKKGKVVDRFSSKSNAEKFKNHYPDELKLERI